MAFPCPDTTCAIYVNSRCSFYESSYLPYTGIATNDSLQTSLQKIELAIKNIIDGGGSGGSAIWGDITGTITNQTDLISYLSSNYTPQSRILTINGTPFDLSVNRTWSVGTVTNVAALTLGTTGTDLSSSVTNPTTTPVITLNVPTASALNRGALSSTDWSTFNAKQAALIGVQGDIIYFSGVNTITNLVKNTTATRYLSNTGTSNNPAWAQINLANGVTGILPLANGGSGSALSDPGFNAVQVWDNTTNTIRLASLSGLIHTTGTNILGFGGSITDSRIVTSSGSGNLAFSAGTVSTVGTAKLEIGLGANAIGFTGYDTTDALDQVSLSFVSGILALGAQTNSGTENVHLRIYATDGNMIITDGRPTPKGFQNAASGYVTDALSLTTKEYVDALVGIVSDGDKGDITVSSFGTVWTIDNDVVTYAKIQNVSATNRFLGRITGGAGDIEELTGTQATTLLNVFTSTLKGLVPLSGGGTTNFLRADGTWAAASGGITNSAANNEIMKSNGTNAVPSGLFVVTNGNINLGTGIAGAFRSINALGSASNVELQLTSKGTLGVTIGPGGFSVGSFTPPGAGTNDIVSVFDLRREPDSGSASANGFGLIETRSLATTTPVTLQNVAKYSYNWVNATTAAVTGKIIMSVGASNSFFDYLSVQASSTTNGNLAFLTNTGSFGSGERVLFIPNATTAATTAPTNGIIFHAKDSSDGSTNSTLALYLEQAVEVIGTFTASHKIKVWINNVEYWLQLDAV